MKDYDIESDRELLPPDYQAHIDKPESLPENWRERCRVLDQRIREIWCNLNNKPVF